MNPRNTMKSAIETILSQLGQLEAFQQNKHFGLKIENEPFMPLSIERHDNIITVTHYFEQNGDLVPDPDVEFVDLGRDDWIPIAIQHSTVHYARAGSYGSGEWQFNTKALRDLQAFAKIWARNLTAQGFGKGHLAYAKAV